MYLLKSSRPISNPLRILLSVLCVLLVGASAGCTGAPSTPLQTVTVTSILPLASSPSQLSPSGATVFSDALTAPLVLGGALESTNWAGYTFALKSVTGVQAEWVEPDISPEEGEQICVWVGIGGMGASQGNLVQAGTLAYIGDNGQVKHVAWYESLPPNQWFWMGDIAAGDHVRATVELVPGTIRTWQLSLSDLTTGQNYGVTLDYDSAGTDADFVVEDPYADASDARLYSPFPRFDTITLSNIHIRLAPGAAQPKTVKGVKLDMVREGLMMASAGPIQNNGFAVGWENRVVPARTTGK